MGKLIQGNPWVWVIVQNPGANEEFLGQHDHEKNISFIPAFLDKEAATKGLKHLARNEALKYEVQAIQYEHLAEQAAENGFVLFILNEQGKVLEKDMLQTKQH